MRIEGKRETLAVQDADASGSRFSETNLSGSSFDDVDMSKVAVSRANLAGARFEDVNLSEGVIENANLTGLEIRDSNLEGMRINGVAVADLLAAYRSRN